MADMTAKHHKLICDAVAKGVALGMEKIFGRDEDGAMGGERSVRPSAVCQAMTIQLAESLSYSLEYTHDKFDGAKFRQTLRATVQDFLEGRRK
jgi:hypothetical protein